MYIRRKFPRDHFATSYSYSGLHCGNGKESLANAGDARDARSISGSGATARGVAESQT